VPFCPFVSQEEAKKLREQLLVVTKEEDDAFAKGEEVFKKSGNHPKGAQYFES
jgi:hypothetical protein